MPIDPTSDTMPTAAARIRRQLPAIVLLLALTALYLHFNRFKAPRTLNVASLELETLGGRPLSSSVTKGRAVVLNFWAPWCGPCALEAPWLQQLQAAHPDQLVVIGVDNDPDTYVEAAQFAATHGLSYPLARKTSAVAQQIGSIDTVPTTLYISPSGAVVHTVTGAVPEKAMEAYAMDTLRH